jgi:hypothetical protein
VESTVAFLVGGMPAGGLAARLRKIKSITAGHSWNISLVAPLQWIFQRSNRLDIPRGTGCDKENGDRKLPQPRRRPNRSSGFSA